MKLSTAQFGSVVEYVRNFWEVISCIPGTSPGDVLHRSGRVCGPTFGHVTRQLDVPCCSDSLSANSSPMWRSSTFIAAVFSPILVPADCIQNCHNVRAERMQVRDTSFRGRGVYPRAFYRHACHDNSLSKWREQVWARIRPRRRCRFAIRKSISRTKSLSSTTHTARVSRRPPYASSRAARAAAARCRSRMSSTAVWPASRRALTAFPSRTTRLIEGYLPRYMQTTWHGLRRCCSARRTCPCRCFELLWQQLKAAAKSGSICLRQPTGRRSSLGLPWRTCRCPCWASIGDSDGHNKKEKVSVTTGLSCLFSAVLTARICTLEADVVELSRICICNNYILRR